MTSLRDHAARNLVPAGILSGLLLWMSFPPLEWNAVAWFALVPMFWLVTLREVRIQRSISPHGWAAWSSGCWLSSGSHCSTWAGLPAGSSWPWSSRHGGRFSWRSRDWRSFACASRLMMAAPIVWVGLEYGRAYFLSGFPWYYLAHSQFRHLYLIQIADFASSLGISLLIAIVNAMVVDLSTLPLFGRSREGIRLSRRQYVRLCVVTCLLGMTLCYGAIRVSTARFADGPRLALLAIEYRAEAQEQRQRQADPRRIHRTGRPGARSPQASGPDRLAGDCLSSTATSPSIPDSHRRPLKNRSTRLHPNGRASEWLARMK